MKYSIAGQVTEQSPGPGKQLLLVQPNACAESKKRRRRNDAVRQCCQEQPKLLYGLAASLGPRGCLSPGLSRLYSDKTLQYWFPFLCACSLQHARLRESALRYAMELITARQLAHLAHCPQAQAAPPWVSQLWQIPMGSHSQLGTLQIPQHKRVKSKDQLQQCKQGPATMLRLTALSLQRLLLQQRCKLLCCEFCHLYRQEGGWAIPAALCWVWFWVTASLPLPQASAPGMVARLLQRPRCLFSRLHLQHHQTHQQPGTPITPFSEQYMTLSNA